jgi:hypothetical protein
MGNARQSTRLLQQVAVQLHTRGGALFTAWVKVRSQK